MSKDVDVFHRIANRAYMLDGKIRYDSEALLLALLLHTGGNAKRTKQDLEQVGKMLNDPNIDKPAPRRFTKR